MFYNDFFINSWYILWTSFWYIPLFVLTLFALFIFHVTERPHQNLLLLLVALLGVMSCVYQNLNINLYHWDLSGENFNTLLSNSINKFHPALFYMSLTVAVLAQSSGLLQQQKTFGGTNSLRLTYWYTMLTTPLIIFTLSLGSWWAAQEGSWGGWWNWDASEVFGLVIMLIHLNTLHKTLSKGEYGLNKLYFNTAWLTALLIYVFIQFNFDLVSHNFGTRSDQFIDTSHNFLTSIILIIVILYLAYLRGISLYFNEKTVKSSVLQTFNLRWQLVMYLVVFYIVAVSFNTLLNDFFWKILQINILNSTPLVNYFTYITLAALVVRLWSPNISITYLLLILWCSVSCGVLFMLASAPTLNSVFHTGLTSVILNTCDEHNSTVSFWDYIYQSTTAKNHNQVLDIGGIFLTLNNFFIECSTVALNNGFVAEPTYNIIWSSSSTENHSFKHALLPWLSEQTLYSGTSLTPYVITVKDLSVVSTLMIVVLLFIQIKPLVSNKNRIIF